MVLSCEKNEDDVDDDDDYGSTTRRILGTHFLFYNSSREYPTSHTHSFFKPSKPAKKVFFCKFHIVLQILLLPLFAAGSGIPLVCNSASVYVCVLCVHVCVTYVHLRTEWTTAAERAE